MLLKINQGPVIYEGRVGFKLTFEEFRLLTNLCTTLYGELPEEVASHVEIIEVFPRNNIPVEQPPGKCVEFHIVLGGGKIHYAQKRHELDDETLWRKEVSGGFRYTSDDIGLDWETNEKRVKNKLVLAIYSALEEALDEISDLHENNSAELRSLLSHKPKKAD